MLREIAPNACITFDAVVYGDGQEPFRSELNAVIDHSRRNLVVLLQMLLLHVNDANGWHGSFACESLKAMSANLKLPP